jgi:hypothetical protein
MYPVGLNTDDDSRQGRHDQLAKEFGTITSIVPLNLSRYRRTDMCTVISVCPSVKFHGLVEWILEVLSTRLHTPTCKMRPWRPLTSQSTLAEQLVIYSVKRTGLNLGRCTSNPKAETLLRGYEDWPALIVQPQMIAVLTELGSTVGQLYL